MESDKTTNELLNLLLSELECWIKDCIEHKNSNTPLDVFDSDLEIVEYYRKKLKEKGLIA